MRPSFHAHTAIVFTFIGSRFLKSTEPYILWFYFGAVIIDMDVIFRIFLKQQNHREYLTHHPLVWLFNIIISGVFGFWFWFSFSLGVFSHLLADTIDWGLPVKPWLNITTWHVLPVPNEISSEAEFAKVYWHSKIILFLESCLLLSVIGILVFSNYILAIPRGSLIFSTTIILDVIFFTEMVMSFVRDV